MTTDAAGDVFIADSGGHRVVEVKTNGTVAVVAGNGTAGVTGDGGAATSADARTRRVGRDHRPLRRPDHRRQRGQRRGPGSSRRRQIITSLLSGAVTGIGGSTIGLNPQGVASDAAGDVFLSDFFDSVVRKVTLQPLTVTVSPSAPAATTTTETPSTTTPVRGQTMTITAVVTANPAGSTPPGGSVVFKNGTFVLATLPLTTVNGVTSAVYTTPALAMGNYTITASYSGDANDNPSVGTTTFTVGPDSTSIVAVANPSDANPVRGEAVTLYALPSPRSATPGPATPTGTVSFKYGSTTIATEPVQMLGSQAYAAAA